MAKKDYSARLQDRWNSKAEKEKRKRQQQVEEFERSVKTFHRLRIDSGFTEIKKRRGNENEEKSL